MLARAQTAAGLSVPSVLHAPVNPPAPASPPVRRTEKAFCLQRPEPEVTVNAAQSDAFCSPFKIRHHRSASKEVDLFLWFPCFTVLKEGVKMTTLFTIRAEQIPLLLNPDRQLKWLEGYFSEIEKNSAGRSESVCSLTECMEANLLIKHVQSGVAGPLTGLASWLMHKEDTQKSSAEPRKQTVTQMTSYYGDNTMSASGLKQLS